MAGIAATYESTTPTVGPAQAGNAAAATDNTPTGSTPSGTAAFGQKITYPSGLAVVVSQPAAFHPSSSAAGASGARAFVVTVTVTNGRQDQYSFNPFAWTPQVVHGGQPGSESVDFEQLQPAIFTGTY